MLYQVQYNGRLVSSMRSHLAPLSILICLCPLLRKLVLAQVRTPAITSKMPHAHIIDDVKSDVQLSTL